MKKRAFTLIELMGVIIILGVIALIAIPTLDRQLKEGKENLSENQKETIEIATKLWVEDNKEKLPESGEGCYIKYDELINAGYLEELKDVTTGENFDNSNLKIEISKNENHNKYSYKIESVDNMVHNSWDLCGANYIGIGDGSKDANGNDISIAAWYDGINNTGSGHSNTTNIWSDLSSSGNYLKAYSQGSGSYIWGNNYLLIQNPEAKYEQNVDSIGSLEGTYFAGNKKFEFTDDSDFTVEIVASTEYTGNKLMPIVSFKEKPEDEDQSLHYAFLENKQFRFGWYHHDNNYNYVDIPLYSAEVYNGQNKSDILYLNNIIQTTAEKVGLNSSGVLRLGVISNYYKSSGLTNKQLYQLAIDLKIYSIRIYYNNLTEEQIIHNYNLDKKRYNLN